MEKIDIFGNKFPYKPSEKRKKVSVHHTGKKDFLSFLRPAETGEETDFSPSESGDDGGELTHLLDDVYEKGDQLKKKPTLDTIKEYKKSIKKFLKIVTDKMLSLDEKVSGVNILKRKKYTLIKVVDDRLESLITEVLRSQGGQLSILKKVDEINGLLVDLMQ